MRNQSYLDTGWYTEREEEMREQGRSLKSGGWKSHFPLERLPSMAMRCMGPGARLLDVSPGAADHSM